MVSAMNSQRFVDRVSGAIDSVLICIAALALLAMMVHISLDVVVDLVLNAPIPLTSAFVTEYYMIAVAFLPLMSAELRNGHTSVDLFTSRLSQSRQRWLEIVVLAFCAVIYAVLAGQGWQQATEKLMSNAYILEHTARITVWPSYFMVPIGYGLIAVLVAIKFVCRLIGSPDPALPMEDNHLVEGAGD